ncbi:Protein NirI [uncultured Defluviicoccus sp.]|uniref:Protein NirI n=1 Tax=metagenome TaxID=256318 RepID=A0A380TBI4_9ZZZZ|nr:Protein NirI [uncultured Defluviicoccus sp.]
MGSKNGANLLRRSRARVPSAVVALLLMITIKAGFAFAAEGGRRTLSAAELEVVFPGAHAAGPFEGQPAAAAVRATDGRLAGYVVSTFETVGSTGYSGKPLDVLVGVDLAGAITGALLVRQTEPILVIGITEEDLRRYVAGFTGIDLTLRGTLAAGAVPDQAYPPVISGASISSAVIRDSIIRAATAVAGSRGLLGRASAAARIDVANFVPATWAELAADGSIACRRFSQADGTRLLLDLCVALATPARIGENLLGKLAHNRLAGSLGADDHAIMIAATGLVSVKGTAFVRSGRFERLQVVQGARTFGLTTAGYVNVEALRIAGAPELREIGVFVMPADAGFDAGAPWRLDALVPGEGAGEPHILSIDYTLPPRYVLSPLPAAPDAEAVVTNVPPLWQETWRSRWPAIAALSLMLAVLSGVLVFQEAVVTRPVFYRRLRLAYLTMTLVWLGWWAGGQLSVVNVLTFVHSLMTGFQWEFFLLDPVIFILWGYVAVALLFLGRGVYCGWLCPFGALQELLAEAARLLRLPQLVVPFALHERLWPLKYIIFLGLFAVSLGSTRLAFVGAEIEPFKTAISLKFMREWPFVVYAVALLVAGMFIERFSCRYLCPLGAALAIPARMRMFEWLKRRPQCGRECGICFQRCPVQAIHPEGQINPNECIHCLNCQRVYADDTICPPLAARRKRRERREALATGAGVKMGED